MSPEVAHTLIRLAEFSTLPPPKVSFEFFPAKTEAMDAMLWDTIRHLEPLQPQFVSVTYGAGGSTRERTHETVKRIVEETTLSPAAHLTCVGASKREINEIAQAYWDAGVRHIVALRGDPPDGNSSYSPHPDGYHYSADLVEGLKKIGDFEISVAAFPETHPEAKSPEDDLNYLKQKIDAGANRAITQFFFDTDIYLNFLERARAAGITVPIVPGIVMIANFNQLLSFNKKCGATIPRWVHRLLEDMDAHPEQRDVLAAMIAAEQCRILREAGIEEFHFYTLNRPVLTAAVCRLLGIRAQS